MKTIKTLVLAAIFIGCSFLTTAPAAVDMFLKIDGVKGESMDKDHVGEIEINSFSWGATNNGSFGSGSGGGGGAGKVNVQDFSIVKYFDAASPDLFIACATGKRISEATLTVRQRPAQNAAPERAEGNFLVIKLQDVLISGINEDGDNSDSQGFLAEKLAIRPSRITITYTFIGPDGKPATKTVTYDLKLNKKA